MVPALLSLRLSLLLPLPCARFGAQPEGRPGGGGAGLLRRVHAPGPGRPDRAAGLTQTWLVVSDDAAAAVSGRYWHHRQVQTPAAQVTDSGFQARLIGTLARLWGEWFTSS